jgi:hypothetical protein
MPSLSFRRRQTLMVTSSEPQSWVLCTGAENCSIGSYKSWQQHAIRQLKAHNLIKISKYYAVVNHRWIAMVSYCLVAG